MSINCTLAAYYFANYHPGDPRNTRLKGASWSEWQLVREARPRFPAHVQPRVPLWGYGDESDPAVMARKTGAAAAHGVDAFIFDWYYYDDGPFLEGALERGYLGMPDRRPVKFALMWANHDWTDIHPARRGVTPALLYPGAVTPATFRAIADRVIARYFRHPDYWRIGGRPYFSIYDLDRLLASFGGVAETRAALEEFRARSREAGAGEPHLNAVAWGRPLLPREQAPADLPALVRDLGFDSATSYVWVHHVGLPDLETDYNWVRDRYLDFFADAERRFPVPFHPNVSVGWDPSPRCHPGSEYAPVGYPFSKTIAGNTPARFGEALARICARLRERPEAGRVVTINSWNEWTEGSYLEPDDINGMGFLEAIARVKGLAPDADGEEV